MKKPYRTTKPSRSVKLEKRRNTYTRSGILVTCHLRWKIKVVKLNHKLLLGRNRDDFLHPQSSAQCLAVLCAEARPSSLHWTQGHPCQSPLCRTSGSRTPQRAFHWVVRPPRAHSSHGTTTKASPYSRRAANGTHRARMRTRPIDDWLQRWRSLRPLAAARRRLSVRCTIGIEPPSFDAVAPGPGRRAYLWDSCRPPIRHRSRVLSPRASVRSGRAARDGHWHPFSTAEP